MKVKDIKKIPKGENEWVIIEFDNGQDWIPAFWELANILRKIAECEDDKYKFGEGRDMVINWAKDAISGMSNEELAELYKIPNRKN